MNVASPTRGTLVLTVLLSFALASRAEPDTSAPSDTATVSVEGVTVTATRAPEDALRVPAALSIIRADRLAVTRQISLDDALRRVPGVFTQSRGGAQDVRITIRGYGARGSGERSNAGSMRGIRVLTDGIPITEPDGRTSLELIDLGAAERVEVLRSNGSVLYGNAAGGVINVKSPVGLDHGTLEAQARAGSFRFHREQAVLGYTLGTSNGTVSAYTSNFDGWRRHSGSSTTSIQNRLSSPINDHTRLGLLLDFVSNLKRYPGPLTQAQLDADPRQANPSFVSRDERRFNRVGRVGVTLDLEPSGSQTLSLASWVEPKALQRSERNRFRDFTRVHAGGSATWQLQTPVSDAWRVVWTAGGDEQFQDGAIQFYDLNPDGSRGTNLIANKREGANSAGAFAQVELRLGEDWSLRLAGRYDNLWYLSEDRIEPGLNATRHFTQVTPKASLARTFGSHTLFAAVGGGVESPAFNEIDPPPPLDTLTSLNPFLEPMRSTSFELGAKGDLASETGRMGRLQYDLALYEIDVRNDIVPWNGGGYFYTAGKTRRRGAEVGLEWTPVSRLTLGGAVTASDNEYVEYANDLGDYGGNQVAGLPRMFLDAEARLRLGGGLSVAGNVRHVGRYFADDANVAAVKAYSVFGAIVELVRPTPFGRLRAFVSGDNLTDERYVASVFINGVSQQYYEAGLPSNFVAGISLAAR
jgi:iron complex outermembrane recepter protein